MRPLLSKAQTVAILRRRSLRKNKNGFGARARLRVSLLLWSSSLSLLQQHPGQKRRGGEAENRLKRKFSSFVVKFAPDLEDKKEEERESFGSKSTISLSLSLSSSSLLLLLPFLLSGVVVVVSIIPRFFRDVEDKTLTNLLLLLLLLLLLFA